MIRCEEVQNCISEYSEGILNAKHAAQVEEHLAGCEACAKELKRLYAVMSLVESTEEIEPPVGMWNAVYNQIVTPETQKKESWADRLRSAFRPPVRALAAGFAVLALLAVTTFTRLEAPVNSPMADASTAEYVQGHAMFAAQDAFADKVGLSSIAAASMAQDKANTQ